MDKERQDIDLPEYIPLKQEVFDKYGIPYRVTTIYQHRYVNGPLKRLTKKDPITGRVFFLAREWKKRFMEGDGDKEEE